MVDPESILARYRLASGEERIPVWLDGPAEGFRVGVLTKLGTAKAAIGLLSAAVEHYSASRGHICAVTQSILGALNEAGEALDAMNTTLDCRGAA